MRVPTLALCVIAGMSVLSLCLSNPWDPKWVENIASNVFASCISLLFLTLLLESIVRRSIANDERTIQSPVAIYLFDKLSAIQQQLAGPRHSIAQQRIEELKSMRGKLSNILRDLSFLSSLLPGIASLPLPKLYRESTIDLLSKTWRFSDSISAYLSSLDQALPAIELTKMATAMTSPLEEWIGQAQRIATMNTSLFSGGGK